MWNLVKNIPIWHPILVAVWDWRMLEAMFNGVVGGSEEEKAMIKDLFYAKMAWNTEWDGQGTVEVTWRDGIVDRIPKKDIEGIRD